MQSYRDLDVFVRGVEFADALYLTVSGWDSLATWTVGVQLIRAGDSVGANIAEGYGRRSDAERRRFLTIARGSATETIHWIGRAEARSLPLPAGATDSAERIGRMLTGLLNSLPC